MSKTYDDDQRHPSGLTGAGETCGHVGGRGLPCVLPKGHAARRHSYMTE